MTDYTRAFPVESYRYRVMTEECPRCGARPDHHCSEYVENVQYRGAFSRQPVHPHLIRQSPPTSAEP